MVKKYACEVCGKEFDTEEECLAHERICNPTITFVCDKCGRTITYKLNDFSDKNMLSKAKCHILYTKDILTYGSRLDSCIIKINLCDDCLCKMVDGLRTNAQNRIYGE